MIKSKLHICFATALKGVCSSHSQTQHVFLSADKEDLSSVHVSLGGVLGEAWFISAILHARDKAGG